MARPLTDLIVSEDVEWVRVTTLRPGDRQLFAGRLLTVAIVIPDGRRTRVMYDEAPERYWGNGVQVQILGRGPDASVREQPNADDEPTPGRPT